MAKSRKKYKKRPLWQWVIFYLIIGGVIYALLYYSGIINGFLNKTGSTTTNFSDYNIFE